MKKLLLFLVATTALWGREEEKADPNSTRELLSILEAQFTAWDADKDGTLSKEELNLLVANPKIQAHEAALVAALKRASRTTKVKLPPFTLAGLQELAQKPKEKDYPHLPSMFTSGVKKISTIKRELFVSGKPRLETIQQGRMGNCFSLAPLGAMARYRPEYIVNEMIRPLGEDRYEVRLGKKTVTVTTPTDTELALTGATESDGIWLNIYEKAAGEAHNELKPAERREATGLDALNKGGSAGTQLAFITGHEMFRLSCKFAKDPKLTTTEYEEKLTEIRKALTAATQEKRLMTCGTTRTKIPGMTPNHAYAVLSYDAGQDLIRVWNPHGTTRTVKGEPGPDNGYPLTDGIFDMPLTVFVKEFAGLAFEILPNS